MTRIAAVCLGVVGLCAAAVAGEPWKLSLDANLCGTYNAYSGNWAGTELGSLAWTTQWNGVAEKQIGAYLNDKSTLKLAFGQTKSQSVDSVGNKRWSKPQKSTDQIDFESVLKLTASTWVDPFVSLRAVSQFLDARDPGLAHYANPIELTEVLGAARDLVKKEHAKWDARLGAAAREHVDRIWDDLTSSSGGFDLATQLEGGMYKDLLKLRSTLRVYEALLRENSDKLPNDWRYPDIDWETVFTVSILKYITINYTVQLLYDREIDYNSRWKNSLSVGLAYAAKRPKPAAQ